MNTRATAASTTSARCRTHAGAVRDGPDGATPP
jgi:hypothetical protein